MNRAVKTGLSAGAINVAIYIGQVYAPRGNATALLNYSLWLVLFASIYYSIKSTRDHERNGIIGLKAGMKAGVTAGALTALLMCICHFFIMTHTDMREVIAEAKSHGATNSDLIGILGNYTNDNFFKLEMVFFALYTIAAFFLSFAAAFFLRRTTSSN
ncbi:MAG TPA: DUF4199 domain-containing protein [Bacteroidia bacterium]|jgi:hypothetical protein|nr:DUF4199 domain-containing protein [Bacteroidia bacterium]